ncbi:MAG: signal peptidase I [Pyrinomonadaceae bacterium]|nr:signal peptidase I [Pyrinomonadaceae bacterium]
MFNLQKKKESSFGVVSADDDQDIEILKYKRASKQGLWFESLRLLRDIFLIVTIFTLLIVFVVQPVVVDGSSMVPELHNGERLIVSKLVYYDIKGFSLGHIERGDIVVFWFPDDPDKSYVKRIIGLPGEMVEIEDGVVYIDGRRLEEPYLNEEFNKSLPDGRSKVKPHYYFVMGDNRDNSSDSRYWGLVPEKYIYGKAFFRYWKPSNLGFIKSGDPQLLEEDIENPEEDEDEEGDDLRAEND